MTNHLDKLRRLRILQILARYDSPAGERVILNNLLSDQELEPTIERVRDSLEYLSNNDLVTLIQIPGSEWMGAILRSDGGYWLQEKGKDFDLEIYTPNYQPPELPAVFNGRNSKVTLLPPETRAWLEQQLIDRNFTNYSELTAILNQQGLEITRSSLGRYAKKLKQRVSKYKEKTELIKSLAGAFNPEDTPDLMQGAFGVGITAVMDAIEEGEYNMGKESLSSLVKALPALGRGFRDTETHKIEQEARRKALDAVVEDFETNQPRGLDDNWARALREKLLKGR